MTYLSPVMMNSEAAPTLGYNAVMNDLDRITFDPNVMGGRACIRGMRVTVGMVVGLIAAGHSTDQILAAYPYLQREDVEQSLRYAAWLTQQRDLPLVAS